MICPTCNRYDTLEVRDSRPVASGYGIRRRRRCVECGASSTAYEVEDVVLRALLEAAGARLRKTQGDGGALSAALALATEAVRRGEPASYAFAAVLRNRRRHRRSDGRPNLGEPRATPAPSRPGRSRPGATRPTSQAPDATDGLLGGRGAR